MKGNKTLPIILIAAGVVGVAVYMFRKYRKKAEAQVDDIVTAGAQVPVTTVPGIDTPPSGGGIFGIGSAISNFLANWNSYRVVTQGGDLMVREKPGTDKKIVAKVKNGAIVSARGFGNPAMPKEVQKANGFSWFEVSLDGGKTIKGYAASNFLKAVQK